MTVVNTKTVIGTVSRNVANLTVAENTDMISDFEPLYSNSIVEVTIVPSANAVFSLIRTSSDDDTETSKFKEGDALTAGCEYLFQISATKGDTLNIQASVAQTSATVILTEVK